MSGKCDKRCLEWSKECEDYNHNLCPTIEARNSGPTEGGTDGTSEGSLAATADRSLVASVYSSPPFSERD